jgi:hypothetical protein
MFGQLGWSANKVNTILKYIREGALGSCRARQTPGPALLVALALTSSSSARQVLRRLFALCDALSLLEYDDDQSTSAFKMLESSL